jgi:hypothetical protein
MGRPAGRPTLAQAINDRAGRVIELAAGTVTALPGAGKVTVTLRGATLSIPKLQWYTPVVGDICMVLICDASYLALGDVG